MIVRLGDVSYSAPAPYVGPAPQSYVGRALDFTAYLWMGLTVFGLLWALNYSPAAKRRAGAVKRAKVTLRKARRLPRVGV